MSRRRVVVGTAVGLPLAAAALLGAQAYIAATAERPEDPTYEVEATVGGHGDALQMAVLGDSTAAGVGAAAVEGALPVLIAERVSGLLDRPVHVVGHGESGARTDDVRREQVPLLAGADVDVVVIAVGANDVTHLNLPWTLRRQTAELLRAAGTSAGGAPVVLAGIPRFDGVARLPQPLRALVVAYAGPMRDAQREAAVAAEGVRLVEIARDASPRFRGVPEAMSADDYHPSPVGYGFWADAIAPEVAAAVSGD